MKPSQIPLFRNFTFAFMVGVYVFPTKAKEQKQTNDTIQTESIIVCGGKDLFLVFPKNRRNQCHLPIHDETLFREIERRTRP